MIKKPAIANLTSQEIDTLIKEIETSQITGSNKGVLVETIGMFHELLEKLKSSQISTKKLKSLLGFYTERLKKPRQAH